MHARVYIMLTQYSAHESFVADLALVEWNIVRDSFAMAVHKIIENYNLFAAIL
jgi:hypothetical protein